MGDLPTGTGQLVISGLQNDIIEEFNKMREIPGKVKRKKKTWEVFEQIWKEWKESKQNTTRQWPEEKIAVAEGGTGRAYGKGLEGVEEMHRELSRKRSGRSPSQTNARREDSSQS